MSNQIDINKFNSFLDKATKAITCGPDCQRTQTANELKNEYINSETKLLLAQPNYELAKKNYYTFIAGENGYNEILEKNLNNVSDKIIDQFKNSLNEEINKIENQLATYEGILVNYDNIVELNKNYKSENIILAKQLKEKTNDILTNDRKTYYEDQEIDMLKKYYSYVFVVIYMIVVLCFAFFSLIYPSDFSLKFRIIILIFFLILPYISTWLLSKLIKLIYWFYSILPKNVYK
jgi:hypothetical protein